MEKKIIYSIEIEGNEDILKAMADIRKENAALVGENKKYQQALKDNTKLTDEQARNYERTAAQIKDNNKKLTDYTKQLKSSGGATRGVRDELTLLRKSMQEMAAAGDTSSEAFVKMRNRASELYDAIDSVNKEVAAFADGEIAINTVVDAAQGLAAGFQLAQSAQALMGVESEKLMEVLVKLQAAQGVVNSLQTISNLLQRESRLIILGKIAAVKVATAAQWLWNKAMTANPIGLIIVGVAALVAGIITLVKNFDKVTQAVKDNSKWFLALLGPIGLVIAAFKHFSKESRDARQATRELKEEQDRLIESNNKLINQLSLKADYLGHQINVMKALGASTEEVRAKEQELINTQIQGALAALQVNEARIQSGKLSKKELEEAQKEGEELRKVYVDLQRAMEIFQAEGTRIAREEEEKRREEAQKTADEAQKIREENRKKQEEERADYLRRETLAAAQLIVLREKTLENEIKLLQTIKDEKLNSDKLTASERLVIEQQFLKDKEALVQSYVDKEITDVKDKLVGSYAERLEQLNLFYQSQVLSHQAYVLLLAEIDEAEKLRKAEEDKVKLEEEEKRLESEREKYLGELETRRQDELTDFQLRKEQLDKWLEEKVLSETEYANELILLNKKIADNEKELMYARVDAGYKATNALLTNMNELAGGSAIIAKFQKLIAITQTIIEISKGAAKTAAIGFPQNIPMLLGYAAQTVGILASIKSIATPTPPKVKAATTPKLEDGGIIGGKPHSMGGTIFRGTDGSVFEAERGEYLAVVNKYDAQRAMMLDTVNQEHGDAFSSSPQRYFATGGMFEPRQDFEKFDIDEVVRQTIDGILSIPVVVSERDISDTQSNVRKMRVSGDLYS